MTTVKVRVTTEVLEAMFTRDYLGNRLRVDWGVPDADGFHNPTIAVDYADNLVTAERARIAEAVRGLPPMMPSTDRWVGRAAVLALLEP